MSDNPEPAAAAAGPDTEGATPVEGIDFLAFLANEAPDACKELGVKLAELTAAVLREQKAGQLTYTIKVTPPKDIDDMVKLEDAIVTKVPAAKRKPIGMRYVHEGGKLSERPERQGEFDFGGLR